MADRAWIVAKEAEISALNAEVSGMIAENNGRMSRDESLAYTEVDFQFKAEELRNIGHDIMINR